MNPSRAPFDSVLRSPDGDLLAMGADGFMASFIGGKWVAGAKFSAAEAFAMRALPAETAVAKLNEARIALAARPAPSPGSVPKDPRLAAFTKEMVEAVKNNLNEQVMKEKVPPGFEQK